MPLSSGSFSRAVNTSSRRTRLPFSSLRNISALAMILDRPFSNSASSCRSLRLMFRISFSAGAYTATASAEPSTVLNSGVRRLTSPRPFIGRVATGARFLYFSSALSGTCVPTVCLSRDIYKRFSIVRRSPAVRRSKSVKYFPPSCVNSAVPTLVRVPFSPLASGQKQSRRIGTK